MSRAVEYINPAGLRQDGRRPGEHRGTTIEFGIDVTADGSCKYSSGKTEILAFVYGPKELSNLSRVKQDLVAVSAAEATFNVEVGMAAFSGERRKNVQRNTKITQELQLAVLEVLPPILILSQYPNSSIDVFIEVLQHDGSEKSACINAAILALADAKISIREMVCAATSGYVSKTVLIDPTLEEQRSGCPQITVAVPPANRKNANASHENSTPMIQYLSTDSRMTEAILTELITLTTQACGPLFEIMHEALRERTLKTLQQRGTQGFVHKQSH